MFANGYDPYNTADLFRRKRLEDTLRVAMTDDRRYLPTGETLRAAIGRYAKVWNEGVMLCDETVEIPAVRPAVWHEMQHGTDLGYDGLGKPPFDMDY